MVKKTKTILIILVAFVIAPVLLGIIYLAFIAINFYQINHNPKYKFNSLPCSSVSRVELGSPQLYDYKKSPAAEFSTNGADIYISAQTSDDRDSPLDFFPSATIYIGDISILPEHGSQNEINIDNVIKINYYGGYYKYSENISLPAGRYRLWIASGREVILYSCEEGGVSDPKPVR
ncbi:MAG TPA: hypothetical protein PKK37_03545 [Candidatus Pacearchaeota archaeon]|jgi:hypothetical protein|nr:MAG: hypothetical protein YFSK_3430 [Candidatus Yanofskybacteria bacterium]HNR81486.1 hypothetical protein [Candidatus Pacearchaeota archaeon]